MRGEYAADERGWLGFGRVGSLRISREQPMCIRGPLRLHLREPGRTCVRPENGWLWPCVAEAWPCVSGCVSSASCVSSPLSDFAATDLPQPVLIPKQLWFGIYRYLLVIKPVRNFAFNFYKRNPYNQQYNLSINNKGTGTHLYAHTVNCILTLRAPDTPVS